MKEMKYKSMLNKIKTNRFAFRLLGTLYKWLPLLMFLCYPTMLIIKALEGFDKDFWLLLCVPAGVLVLVTVLRKVINRTRPYEKFSTPPLFEKDGNGESFPSRHTASAFIIAMGGFSLNLWLGISLLIIATAIGASRVLSGVHYLSDVVAGCALSVIIGLLFILV